MYITNIDEKEKSVETDLSIVRKDSSKGRIDERGQRNKHIEKSNMMLTEKKFKY